MKIVPIYGGSIFSTKYWNNKVLFLKTALLKNKIITIFVKLVHKSFVTWNKKSSLEYTFNIYSFWEMLPAFYGKAVNSSG